MATRPTPSKLRAAYRRLGSVPAVARDLDVAFETARRWLVEAGVQLQPKGRPSSNASALDPSVLERRYERRREHRSARPRLRREPGDRSISADRGRGRAPAETRLEVLTATPNGQLRRALNHSSARQMKILDSREYF